MRKKYQILEIKNIESNNAGKKAPDDVAKIADDLGFERINIIRKGKNKTLCSRLYRQLNFLNTWEKIYNKIAVDSVLLIQTPSYEHELNRAHILYKLKNQKHVKFIFVVHDVEKLRKIYSSKFYDEQFNLMLEIADKIIVHNKIMKKYFLEQGCSSDKLENLQIFDYLVKNYKYAKPKFSKKVIIAGNLDVTKVAYLKEIHKIKVNFILYGSKFSLDKYKNLDYRGSFSPDKLPCVLNEGFGLVWDGDSIKTCSGSFGQYLKYNDPHKLSLYLAAGIPVVIWSQAAEAEFVVKNKIGLTIDSLTELPRLLDAITVEEYEKMAFNVRKINKGIINGDHMKNTLIKSLESLKKDN